MLFIQIINSTTRLQSIPGGLTALLNSRKGLCIYWLFLITLCFDIFLQGSLVKINTREMSFVVDHVVIESGGRLSGIGGGYATGLGPGAGTSLQGGSYGSLGGRASAGKYYGSLYVPRHPGSGGGGSAGGSWINVTAGRYARIDGTADVNGADGYGAGSGGSLTIKTSELIGYGSIESNGGMIFRIN